MFRRLAVAALALSAAGCAGKQKAPEGGPAAAPVSKETRERLNNLTYFDLANCSPRELKVPEPASAPGIIGAVAATRPQVLECLVDPKNRGPGDATRVVVNATVDQTQAKYAVSGENMTPEGTACVEKVLNERIPLKPLPAGLQPVTAQAEIVHSGRAPAVHMGVNPASDIAGTIRMAQPQFCECYADFKDSVPPALKVALDLPANQTKLSPPTFEPAPGAEKIISCLTTKLQALDFTANSAETRIPAYPFFAINSNASQPATGLADDLRFTHLDAVRAQRLADVALALGERTNAFVTYDAEVKKYQALPPAQKNRYNPKLLVDKCAALVKSDGVWLGSLQEQQQVAQRILTFVQESKAKDPAWTEVEAPAQAQVDTATKDLAEGQAVKAADEKSCPKVRY